MLHLMVAMARTDKGNWDCEFFYSPEKQFEPGHFNLLKFHAVLCFTIATERGARLSVLNV
jgi:hypothetical protein